MNKGRLIMILAQDPTPETRQAFHNLCRELDAKEDTPTFAIGLVKDVTLTLTCKWPQLIYNAFEFIPLEDPRAYQMVTFTEVYTVLGGQALPHIPSVAKEAMAPSSHPLQ